MGKVYKGLMPPGYLVALTLLAAVQLACALVNRSAFLAALRLARPEDRPAIVRAWRKR